MGYRATSTKNGEKERVLKKKIPELSQIVQLGSRVFFFFCRSAIDLV